MFFYKPYLKKLARKLRSEMTETEVRLWNRMKGRQLNDLRFYRQRPLGKYIVDFYCPTQSLVIEIDGSQHCEEEGQRKDRKRDDYLKQLGIEVLRFSTLDVLNNIDGVLETIVLHTQIPLVPPSSKGETGNSIRS